MMNQQRQVLHLTVGEVHWRQVDAGDIEVQNDIHVEIEFPNDVVDNNNFHRINQGMGGMPLINVVRGAAAPAAQYRLFGYAIPPIPSLLAFILVLGLFIPICPTLHLQFVVFVIASTLAYYLRADAYNKLKTMAHVSKTGVKFIARIALLLYAIQVLKNADVCNFNAAVPPMP